MKGSQLDSLLRRNTLVAISDLKNEALMEHALEAGDVDSSLVKNLCTRISVSLSDDIDNLCTALGMTKRAFCESAFVEAVQRAKEIMEEEGFNEVVEELATDNSGR